jgi:predicted dithiol-disulfide oxidoreductase (DUF899 family)
LSDSRDPFILTMPKASEAYHDQREKLRLAERALIEQCEAVAVLRRALPDGPVVRDYEFEDVHDGSVRLSQLFATDKPELAIYHLMYFADEDDFCPMCTLWLDGMNGVAHHIAQRANIAVASRAPAKRLREWAEKRGWHRLRLLSDRGPDFAIDTGAQDEDGRPDSTVIVFKKHGSEIRHIYTGRPFIDGKQRNLDLLCPVWHTLDLLPSGRGEWFASNDYI